MALGKAFPLFVVFSVVCVFSQENYQNNNPPPPTNIGAQSDNVKGQEYHVEYHQSQTEAVPSTPQYNQGIQSQKESEPATPHYNQQQAVPATPQYHQQQAVPATPQYHQQQAVPATPQYQKQETVPASPQYQQQETVPATPEYQQQETVPATPQFQQQETVPATPQYQQQETVPATPQYQQQEVVPPTSQYQQHQAVPAEYNVHIPVEVPPVVHRNVQHDAATPQHSIPASYQYNPSPLEKVKPSVAKETPHVYHQATPAEVGSMASSVPAPRASDSAIINDLPTVVEDIERLTQEIEADRSSSNEDTSYDTPELPIFHDYLWVLDGVSFSHAGLCIVCYILLTAKVLKDKTALGISIQTILALTFSEVVGFTLTLVFSIKYNMTLGWSFYIVDGSSTLLALFCLYCCMTRFNNSYEDQYDTFGLNLYNRALLLVRSSAIDKDAFDRGCPAGMLRPTGTIGRMAEKTYWLALYVCALPIGVFFFYFRSSVLSSFLSFVLAYDDAVRAVAIIPQLYMFHIKKPRRVSEHLAIFVCCEFVLKLLSLIYWIAMPLFRVYVHETRTYNTIVQVLNIAALFDFVFHYAKSKLKGEKALKYAQELGVSIKEGK